MEKISGKAAWGRLLIRSYDEEKNIFFLASDFKEYFLGACFEGGLLNGGDDGLVEKLISALSVALPDDSVVQIVNFAEPNIDSFVSGYLRNKLNDPTIFSEYSQKRASFIQSGVDAPLIRRSGVFLRNQRLIVTLKCPISGKPTDADLESFNSVMSRFSDGLRATGIAIDQLDVGAYMKLLRTIHGLYQKHSADINDLEPLREQVFAPGDSISFEKDHIVFNDDVYAKIISMRLLPKQSSLALMNQITGHPDGINNQITSPYYMALTIRYPNQVEKANQVRMNAAIIHHQSTGPMAALLPNMKYKRAGFDVLMDEMDGHGGVICEMNLSLVIFSRNYKELDALSAAIQTYYSSLQFDVRSDKRILAPLWYSILPLNMTKKGSEGLSRFMTMTVRHLTQFAPIIGEWRGTSLISGASIFFSPRGQVALFDFYDSPTNYNFLIAAESGAGKSFLTQCFLMDQLSDGSKAWVIDVGRSYKKLNHVVGGSFIEFTEESDICLNPFTFIEDIDDEMDMLKALVEKMSSPIGGLNDFQMSVVEQGIKGVWSRYGNTANIDALAQWFLAQPREEIQDIGQQLFPFTSLGSFGKWFNAANNLDLDNRFVVLELEELNGRSHLQKVVLLLLIARINREMFMTRGKRKMLVVDEAWNLLDDPVMGRAMEAAFRRARKADGSIGVVTQKISDLVTSSSGLAMYENAAHRIIMSQQTDSINRAIKEGNFVIDAYGEWRLKQVHTVPGEYAEFMVLRDEDYAVLRYVADRFTQVMFSTKGAERNEPLDDMERGMSATDAINKFIAKENRNGK